MTAIDPAASLRIQACVSAKRRGVRLTDDEIETVVTDFVQGRVANYQMAAWLATVAAVGMSRAETLALTRAYMGPVSQRRPTGPTEPVVDKHSTGGVGDKTTLIVAPIVAACDVNMVKMSGRGLGYAGGTIDKLEAIPGMRLDLSWEEVRRIVKDVGMVITSQSADLAPGDGATYALRDVTGTVESIPLIAASIMSKKASLSADGLVLDVKTGEGALIPDADDARELALLMVELGQALGLRCKALLTDMNEPMGSHVGNALEVREAMAVLAGEEVRGLSEPCRALAAALLQSGLPGIGEEEAHTLVTKAVDSGRALEVFYRWVAAQGGDAVAVEDGRGLPRAESVQTVTAAESGWLRGASPRLIGRACLRVGAGRVSAQQALDHSAGVVVHHRVGDYVEAGSVLAELHHNRVDINDALRDLTQAFVVGKEQCRPHPGIHEIIDPSSDLPSSNQQKGMASC